MTDKIEDDEELTTGKVVSKKKSENYTSDEFEDAVEAAREEERTKARAELAELGEENEDLKEQLKKAQKPGTRSTQLADAIKDAVSQAREKWEEQHKKELRELRKEVGTLSAKNKAADVAQWRVEAIEQYSGQVIPALVVGETEEEIAESAEAAHEAWKDTMVAAGVEIVESTEETPGDEEEDATPAEEEEEEEEGEVAPPAHRSLTAADRTKFKTSAGVRTPVILKPNSQPVAKKLQAKVVSVPVPAGSGINGGGRRSEPSQLLRSAREMTPTEYRQHRQEILAAARREFASSGA